MTTSSLFRRLSATLALAVLALAPVACNSAGAEDRPTSRPAESAANGNDGKESAVSDTLPEPTKDLAPAEVADGATRHAVFAGGCFWCTEAVFEQLEGVTDVVSGYAGGTEETADYKSVSSGRTDHAEVIRITYDPSQISYGQLLRIFFATHDPTQLNRQGPDRGRHYRSAVFYGSAEEKAIAASYIDQLTEAKVFKKKIVTTLEPLEAFYPAEAYHQDYAQCNPGNPYVRINALPKVEKVKQKYGGMTKE